MIDNTGTVKDAIVYDSFGKIQSSELNPSFRGWYAWTGRELDQNIDLQYNHARWYDGQTGRWINQDPMGFDAGDSNLYRYVNNIPANRTDPAGMQGPQVGPGPNEPLLGKNTMNTTWYLFSCGVPRDKQLGATARLTKPDLSRKPDDFIPRNIIQLGTNEFYAGQIKSKKYLEISGAGPCVGMILIPPKGFNTYAFHFAATSNLGDTMTRLRVTFRTDRQLQGYKAVILGAEHQTERDAERQMQATLYRALSWLKEKSVPVDAYIEGPNAAIDATGTLYWTTPGGVDLQGYKRK